MISRIGRFPPNRESNLVITQPAPEIVKQVILVVDDDVAVLAYLIAFDDVAVRDLVVALRAPALIGDGRLVVGAQLSK